MIKTSCIYSKEFNTHCSVQEKKNIISKVDVQTEEHCRVTKQWHERIHQTVTEGKHHGPDSAKHKGVQNIVQKLLEGRQN